MFGRKLADVEGIDICTAHTISFFEIWKHKRLLAISVIFFLPFLFLENSNFHCSPRHGETDTPMAGVGYVGNPISGNPSGRVYKEPEPFLQPVANY